MNKTEFLQALAKKLPHRGKPLRSILNFYGEMIDDLVEEGLSQDEAIERIGSVEEVAEGILSDGAPLGTNPKGRRAGEILLLVLGAPLWFSLLLAGLAVGLSLYAVLWSLIAALWAIELPFLLFSLVSKYLFSACRETTFTALALTRRGVSLTLGLFKKGSAA